MCLHLEGAPTGLWFSANIGVGRLDRRARRRVDGGNILDLIPLLLVRLVVLVDEVGVLDAVAVHERVAVGGQPLWRWRELQRGCYVFRPPRRVHDKGGAAASRSASICFSLDQSLLMIVRRGDLSLRRVRGIQNDGEHRLVWCSMREESVPATTNETRPSTRKQLSDSSREMTAFDSASV